MDFLITGLGARIWSQLGGQLGSLKCSQKQEKPLFLSIWAHFDVLLWGCLWAGLGPALSPAWRPILFSPFHFYSPLHFFPLGKMDSYVVLQMQKGIQNGSQNGDNFDDIWSFRGKLCFPCEVIWTAQASQIHTLWVSASSCFGPLGLPFDTLVLASILEGFWAHFGRVRRRAGHPLE